MRELFEYKVLSTGTQQQRHDKISRKLLFILARRLKRTSQNDLNVLRQLIVTDVLFINNRRFQNHQHLTADTMSNQLITASYSPTHYFIITFSYRFNLYPKSKKKNSTFCFKIIEASFLGGFNTLLT